VTFHPQFSFCTTAGLFAPKKVAEIALNTVDLSEETVRVAIAQKQDFFALIQ
jgi:uncharacterized NAD-dependent epimerase/dehydratase family protein